MYDAPHMSKTPRNYWLTLSLMALIATAMSMLGGCKKGSDASGNSAAVQAAVPPPQVQQAQQDAEDKAEAHRQEVAAKDEAKKVDLAKHYLYDRIRIYQGISGNYYARYSGGDSLVFDTNLRIQTDNVPPQEIIDRAVHVDEVESLMSGLSLSMDADDGIVDQAHSRVLCEGTGIRPDLYAGRIHIACTTTTGTNRFYDLFFDYFDGDFTETSSLKIIHAKNKTVAADLLVGRINALDAMDMTIKGGEVTLFGKLKRMNSN